MSKDSKDWLFNLEDPTNYYECDKLDEVEEFNNTKEENNEKERDINKMSNSRYVFAKFLDFMAIFSIVISLFGTWIMVIAKVGAAIIIPFAISGFFSAIWWHLAALIAEACHKYINRA